MNKRLVSPVNAKYLGLAVGVALLELAWQHYSRESFQTFWLPGTLFAVIFLWSGYGIDSQNRGSMSWSRALGEAVGTCIAVVVVLAAVRCVLFVAGVIGPRLIPW